jgi:hypothetical protein
MAHALTKLAVIASVALACYIAVDAPAEQASSKERTSFNDSLKAELQSRAAAMLVRSCATSGCHSGKSPRMKLNLERASILESLRDVQSRQIDTLKLVDTKKPERSYLIMKLKGTKGIRGDRMPIDAKPLKNEDIQTIELWIHSVAVLDTTKQNASGGR